MSKSPVNCPLHGTHIVEGRGFGAACPKCAERAIYRLWNDGLGDHWASLNLLAHISSWTRKQVVFTTHAHLQERTREILAALNLPESADLLRHVNPDPLETTQLNGFLVWSAPYFPTHRQWIDKKAERYICVQFDGVSSAQAKNPSKEDQQSIIRWATSQGLCVLDLGGENRMKMELSQVVDQLARCALFVGCDSGISHIAHSVGCPTYILEYNLPVVTCHRHKRYVLCRGAEHFKAQADNWMNWLQFLHDQK